MESLGLQFFKVKSAKSRSLASPDIFRARPKGCSVRRSQALTHGGAGFEHRFHKKSWASSDGRYHCRIFQVRHKLSMKEGYVRSLHTGSTPRHLVCALRGRQLWKPVYRDRALASRAFGGRSSVGEVVSRGKQRRTTNSL